MKYILALTLFMGLAQAEVEMTEEIEAGPSDDCMIIGTMNDAAITHDLGEIQQQITDCLAPQEEQVMDDHRKHPEVVSQ